MITKEQIIQQGTQASVHMPELFAGIYPGFSQMTKVGPMLHEATYDTLNYEFAYEFFMKNAPINVGMCSAIRVGSLFGRNLDWYKPKNYSDGQPRFVIHTPRTDKFFATMGVASVAKLTEAMAAGHEATELFTALPFYLQDGFNEKGVFGCVNVVPIDKGVTTFTEPTGELHETLSSLMLLRFVLDRFSSADEAREYLTRHTSIYMPTAMHDMGFEVHFIIADATKTYVLEFINNRLVFTEHDRMTNFFVSGVTFNEDGTVYTNADSPRHTPTSVGVTPYGTGLERYNIFATHSPSSSEDMRNLMNRLFFSHAYDLSTHPFWYSDYTGVYEEGENITVDTPIDDADLQAVILKAQEIKRGEREGLLWETVHSSVYDLANGTLNIVLNEDLTHVLTFSLKGKEEQVPSGALMIQSSAYVTQEGLKVPSLTVEQVLEAYNTIIAGRGCIIVDKDETAHCYINQADSLNGEISVGILYYNILITYTITEDYVTITLKNLN